jgi:hypothetical protein
LQLQEHLQEASGSHVAIVRPILDSRCQGWRATITTMISFAELLQAAPEVAEPIQRRIEATGLALVGTIRADGSPRVSPIEVLVRDGRLQLGMMPGSRKAVDVGRDPRVCLLTPVADKDDLGGEGKLFGALRRLDDPDEVAALFAAATEGTDWDATDLDGSPAFEVLVSAAAWQRVEDDAFVTSSWDPRRGVRHRTRVGATGEVVDLAG